MTSNSAFLPPSKCLRTSSVPGSVLGPEAVSQGTRETASCFHCHDAGGEWEPGQEKCECAESSEEMREGESLESPPRSRREGQLPQQTLRRHNHGGRKNDSRGCKGTRAWASWLAANQAGSPERSRWQLQSEESEPTDAFGAIFILYKLVQSRLRELYFLKEKPNLDQHL